MGLFDAEYIAKDSTPNRYAYDVVGYRIYPTGWKVCYGDQNRRRFRSLLLSLKQRSPFAIQVFAGLLSLIYDDLLGGHDAIACVPSSSASTEVRTDALALVVREAIALNARVTDGSSWLRRVRDVHKAHVDPAMRCFSSQYETIACAAGNAQEKPSRILLIDDIVTSGSSARAGVARLRESFPGAAITVFAFGRTAWVPKATPSIPAFPAESHSSQESAAIVESWRAEGWPLPLGQRQSPFFVVGGTVHEAGSCCGALQNGSTEACWSKCDAERKHLKVCMSCCPFRKAPLFLFNYYSNRIHHVDCHTGPEGKGYVRLSSLRQGIRMGGELCRNCMGAWPVARRLVQARQPRGLGVQGQRVSA